MAAAADVLCGARRVRAYFPALALLDRVGAEKSVMSCDLRLLVYEADEGISSLSEWPNCCSGCGGVRRAAADGSMCKRCKR